MRNDYASKGAVSIARTTPLGLCKERVYNSIGAVGVLSTTLLVL